MIFDFDDEFASPADYARLYRSVGMQVVPAFMPREAKAWKRPNVGEWKQYTEELITDDQFEKWYGKDGLHSARSNMGLITGVGPRRIIVVDLDTHKNPKAQIWWDGIHGDNNAGILTETVAQRTGGGGLQYFFLAPDGWTCPTLKNSELGVDIRGANGFAMLPPSLHESGKHYEWLEGYAPWEFEIEVLPDWMKAEIDRLGVSHTSTGDRIKTSTPSQQVDPWGKIVDGREDLMTRMVFKSVLELYRDCPIIPSQKEQDIAMAASFAIYLDAVDPRLHEPGSDREALLEKEGRGRSLFEKKWRAAIKQWDEKISVEAARPFVKEEPPKIDPFADPPPHAGKKEDDLEKEFSSDEKIHVEPPEAPKKKLLKLYTISEIKSFGPVKAIVQDTIAEGSLGFIYGQPGCGKTFVALSLGLSIAHGFEHWFWEKKIERCGPVIYISLEGKADLGNRLRAWQLHHGITDDNDRFRAIIDEVNFLSDESIKIFINSIDDYVSSDEPPAMIFIDTVSRAIAGGAENDQQEMSKFIQTCDRIKNRYTTNVTGIHHSGRFGTHMRGSTTFDGGADFMYRVERSKEDGLNGLIHAEKIKAYADKWEMPFRLAKIDLDAFGTQSSLVATSVMQDAPAAKSEDPAPAFGGKQETDKEPDMDTCRKMVDAIDEAFRGGYAWSRDKKSRDTNRYAPEKLSNMFGLPVEMCEKYVNMWHRNDVIVTDVWGEKSNKRGLKKGKGL